MVRGSLVPLALLAVALTVLPSASTNAVIDPLDHGPLERALGTTEDSDIRTGPYGNDADAAYRIVFDCTTERGQAPLGSQVFCPAHVLDIHDAMSQPVLLVDPDNPWRVAFNALHGSHGVHPGIDGDGPPDARSRDNDIHQPHTTFRSVDQGALWADNPYDAPRSLYRDGRQVFGTDNAAALDADGRIYLASLYAHREAPAPPAVASGPFHYAIGLWKAGRIAEDIDYSSNVLVWHTGNDGANRADSIHALHVPETGRVVVLWRETNASAGPEGATSDNTSVVHAIWTDTERGAVWSPLEIEPAIGPCRSTTDPVRVGGEILIGCQPGDGYRFPANATDGLQIHAFDASTGASRHVASTEVPGDEVRLIGRGPYGHLVAASALVADDGPHLYMAYGDADGRWSDVRDRVEDVTVQGTDGAHVVAARVTAGAYRADSSTIHLIYMERYEPADAAGQRQPQARYYKALVTLHGEGPVETVTDLQIGQLNRADLSTAQNAEGLDLFEDLHDDLAMWVDPDTGHVTEYIAFGDHGYVRFGRVVEQDPPPAVALAAPNIPPIPLATAGINPAVYGAAAGILAGAMVARFLAARRKVALEVEVKS